MNAIEASSLVMTAAHRQREVALQRARYETALAQGRADHEFLVGAARWDTWAFMPSIAEPPAGGAE